MGLFPRLVLLGKELPLICMLPSAWPALLAWRREQPGTALLPPQPPTCCSHTTAALVAAGPPPAHRRTPLLPCSIAVDKDVLRINVERSEETKEDKEEAGWKWHR